MSTPAPSPTATGAIRPALTDDDAVVARLAALDSAETPDRPLLLGIVDGTAVAALSVTTGAVVADPFAPTADIVDLLRRRAARLRGEVRSRRRFTTLRGGGGPRRALSRR